MSVGLSVCMRVCVHVDAHVCVFVCMCKTCFGRCLLSYLMSKLCNYIAKICCTFSQSIFLCLNERNTFTQWQAKGGRVCLPNAPMCFRWEGYDI